MDFADSPEHAAFRSDVRRWLEAHLPPEICVDDAADQLAVIQLVPDPGRLRDEVVVPHVGARVALSRRHLLRGCHHQVASPSHV